MTLCDLEIAVASLTAIPPGEGRNFEVAGERIAVFHTRSGQVFAVQAACPHKGGPLADGLVGGTTVVCPLHSWKFDLSTGEPVMGSCKLKMYPARVDEHSRVVIRLPTPESPEIIV
jgi:nitrite reductase [NAD(P)H] small subunit